MYHMLFKLYLILQYHFTIDFIMDNRTGNEYSDQD